MGAEQTVGGFGLIGLQERVKLLNGTFQGTHCARARIYIGGGSTRMNIPIPILIVDDQALFREGLHTLLSVQPDFDVIGEAANGEEAMRLAVQFQPAVSLNGLANASNGWCHSNPQA